MINPLILALEQPNSRKFLVLRDCIAIKGLYAIALLSLIRLVVTPSNIVLSAISTFKCERPNDMRNTTELPVNYFVTLMMRW
jgi:hypothetical protein